LSDFLQFSNVAELLPDANNIYYHYNDPFQSSSGVYYRVAAHLNDGSIEYSPLARILPDPAVSKPFLTFDFINNNVRVSLPENWQQGEIILYDLQGRTVFNKKLSKEPLVELHHPVHPVVIL
jgi:hypothetical protein